MWAGLRVFAIYLRRNRELNISYGSGRGFSNCFGRNGELNINYGSGRNRFLNKN